MTEHFGWKITTADLIDWYSHGSTLRSLTYYQHVFSVKLIHERLPTLGEKFTASPTKFCPCCKHQEETNQHFLTCDKNPHRCTEIQDSLKPIFNRHDIDPILRLLIQRALANNPITIDILEGMHPIIDFEPYDDLIAEQNEIGWNQLHLGRYGLSWDRCQRRFLEQKYDKRISGEPKWIRQVIRDTWRHHHLRWKARNEQLHGPNTGYASSQATRLSLLTRIQALYKHEQNLLVQDRTPFQTDIEDWETKTTVAMKQWLTSNTPYIKTALQLAKQQLKQNASDIRRFIPTTSSTIPRKTTQKKRKKKRSKSKDIRQFGNTKQNQNNTFQPPNAQQARELYPTQYKQASIFAYTRRPTDIDQLNIASLTI
jgi:hypothetical protein